jgi:hypothetical protein
MHFQHPTTGHIHNNDNKSNNKKEMKGASLKSATNLDVARVAEHDNGERAHGGGLHQLHASTATIAPPWGETLLEEGQVPAVEELALRMERFRISVGKRISVSTLESFPLCPFFISYYSSWHARNPFFFVNLLGREGSGSIIDRISVHFNPFALNLVVALLPAPGSFASAAATATRVRFSSSSAGTTPSAGSRSDAVTAPSTAPF